MEVWLEELRVKVEEGEVSLEPKTDMEVSLEPETEEEISLESKTLEEGSHEPVTAVEESLEPRTTGEGSLEPEAVRGDSLEPETVKGRRGGRGSRMRRLLAYQRQLSVEKRLPLSRLLKHRTDARSPWRGRKEQERSQHRPH